MAQNTTSEALLRLKPLENTDLGSIVEGHIRYWRKTRNAEEAEELARKAKQQELQRNLTKDTFEIYNGLQPEENAGYLNAQIVDTFEKRKPYLMELAKAAASGNMDARLALSDEKRKIDSLVKVNSVYSEKIKELNELKANGVFNEVLDSDLERFKDAITSGKFRVNPTDWSLDVYSPALEGQIKDTSTGLRSNGIVKLNSSTLFNNDFLNGTFSKPAQFDTNGQAIANNILDSIDGQQEITPQTRKDGVAQVKSIFAQDQSELRSWYGTAVKRGLVNFNKPVNQLDADQLNQLADTYYEANTLPKIQETLNPLDIAKKEQDLAKGRRDAKQEITTISASTDEAGEFINNLDLEIPFVSQEGDRLFNLSGKPITFGVKGKAGTNETFNALLRNQQGKVFAIGQRIIKEDVPVLNPDGTKKFTKTGGNAITRTQERVVDIITDNSTTLNNIAGLLNDEGGNEFRNLNELNVFMGEEELEQEEVIESRQFPLD